MSWETTTLESETGANSFDYKLQQYLVIDSLTGFMIGNNSGAEISNSTDENRPFDKSNYKTVLFKTVDGGLSFRKSTLGKGSLEQIVKDAEQNLYVIRVTYMNDDVNTKKYSIQKSADLGVSWKTISDFNTQKIRNVQFYDRNIGIVCVTNDNKNYELLKTVNGGKTWDTFPISNTGVSILNMRFINKHELYTTVTHTQKEQTATVHFDSKSIQIHDCDIPKGHRFSSYFEDGDTLYSEVYKYAPDESHQLMIYNHTTHTLKKYDFMSRGDELSLGATIAGNYIGVLRQDKGKTYYFYSNDNGINWIKEGLPDALTASHPIALHGKGLVWVRNAVRNIYGIQVRKPD